MNNMIISGKNSVSEALNSDTTINALYVVKDAKGVGEHIAVAKKRGIVIKQVTSQKLDELTASESGERVRHGGIAAALSATDYSSVEEILESSAKPFVLLCDGIEDPHNLGALIRTAEAAGVTGVIIPKRRNVAITPAVYSASAGAAAHMKIARVTNLVDAIKTLKKHQVWVYGAQVGGAGYTETDFGGGGVALVIGSEGQGLSRLVREHCDFVVGIPMWGKINSLNASVSGGILMFAIADARGGDSG
jgi:23S rRNA (guanosine2251-2'-O)-methyltransferase